MPKATVVRKTQSLLDSGDSTSNVRMGFHDTYGALAGALSEAYHYDGPKLGAQLSAIARRNFGIVYRYGSQDHARF